MRLRLPPSAVFGDDDDRGDAVDAWAYLLEAEFDRARQLRAIARIVRAFSHAMAPVPRLSFLGLGHWRLRSGPTGPVPFGWRRWRGADRGIIHVLPVWLWAGLWLWRARWAPVEWGIRLGVVQLDDGDFYRNARPCWPDWCRSLVWCFLNDRDRAPNWTADRARAREERETQTRAHLAQFRATLAADGREFFA